MDVKKLVAELREDPRLVEILDTETGKLLAWRMFKLATRKHQVRYRCGSTFDEMEIPSSSSPQPHIVVLEEAPTDYPEPFWFSCTCKGWKFAKTDDEGHRNECRHIREAKGLHCDWKQPDGDEQDYEECPICGHSVIREMGKAP